MAGRTRNRQQQRQRRQAHDAAVVAARARRKQRNRVIVAAFLALVLVLSIVTLVGGNRTGPTKVSSGPSTTAAPAVSLPTPPDGATISGDTPCPKPDGSSPRTLHFAKPPPLCISPDRRYTAEIKTTMGTINAVLDAKSAPATVNNFVVLARYHYFDGISFHRIVPGFVIQGGDPLESGLGDPGYKLQDELPTGASPYGLGALAMAHPDNAPNSNGSQFFIVSGSVGSQIPPQYSLFGQVTPDSLDVVKKIDAVGSADQSGAPTAVVTIESVTIKEA